MANLGKLTLDIDLTDRAKKAVELSDILNNLRTESEYDAELIDKAQLILQDMLKVADTPDA